MGLVHLLTVVSGVGPLAGRQLSLGSGEPSLSWSSCRVVIREASFREPGLGVAATHGYGVRRSERG